MQMMRILIGVLAMVCAMSAAERDFEHDVLPLLRSQCFSCHGIEEAKAGINLEVLADDEAYQADPELLDYLHFVVAEEIMPPIDSPQPTAAERAALVAWMEELLGELRDAAPNDPGVVVMPRLTPGDYDRVIRDLTGHAIGVGRYLPQEGGAGEGFANVGAAQTESPIWIEGYLGAAKQVLAHLRVYPRSGMHWRAAPWPVAETAADLRKELVVSWNDWFESQRLRVFAPHNAVLEERYGDVYVPYLAAAWRYRYRAALGRPQATMAEIAAEVDEHLYPLVAERLLALIAGERDLGRFFAEYRAWWQQLPAPDEQPDFDILAAARSWMRRYHQLVETTRFSQELAPFEQVPRELREQRGGYKNWRFEIDAGRWPLELHVDELDVVHLVTSDCGDGNQHDQVHWHQGVFHFADGRTRPWQTVLAELELIDGGHATALAWGYDVDDSGRAAADGVVLNAPAVLRIPVPAGAQLFTVRADALGEPGTPASMQIAATADEPAPELRHYLPGRRAFAPGESPAVAALIEARKRGLEPFDPRPQWLHLQERMVFAGRDDLPLDYLPVPDELEVRPDYLVKPLNPSAEELRGYASAADRAELAALAELLHEVAQPAHQDLRAFLADHGQEQWREATVVQAAPDPSWDGATRARFDELHHAVAEIEAAMAAAARAQVGEFTRRAWRGELPSADLDELMGFYRTARSDGASYDAAVKHALLAALMAPRFLYRFQDSRDSAEAYALSDHELATRLAFTLWGSLPDQRLLDLAAEGRLADPEVLAAEARRLIADERSRALIDEFAAHWLDFAGLADFTGPDPERFPEFTPELRASMHEEVVRFLGEIFRDDRSLFAIVDADWTWLDARLAEHYGIDGVEGEGWQRVPLPDRSRGGILGMAGFLTRTSMPLRTSPVLRGAWVVERVVGIHLPPPPPDVAMISQDERDADGLSVHEQLGMHRDSPACAGCHRIIDPPGLALEHFDPIGRWRASDLAGQAIDDMATTMDGEAIAGIAGVRDYVLVHEREHFVRNACRKLLGYMLGRPVAITDDPLIDDMVAALEANDYRVQTMIDQVVRSRQFRFRRDEIE